jgi:hypothetical protein
MEGYSLNTTLSIQQYNTRILVILIYTHCARVACELGKRYSRCVPCYRYRHKHGCGVAVTTAGICLRGHEFKSPWGHVYFFNFS